MAGQERSTSGDLCRKWLKRIQSIADICSGRPRTEYCRSLKNSQQLFPHYVYVLLLAPKLQCASDSASSGQSFRVVRCQNQNMWALQAKCRSGFTLLDRLLKLRNRTSCCKELCRLHVQEEADAPSSLQETAAWLRSHAPDIDAKSGAQAAKQAPRAWPSKDMQLWDRMHKSYVTSHRIEVMPHPCPGGTLTQKVQSTTQP